MPKKLSIYLSDETAMLLADIADAQGTNISKTVDKAIKETAEQLGYKIVTSNVQIFRPDGVELK
jgi:S-adenosylmethionine/arginine decarboxylase-like enzyme